MNLEGIRRVMSLEAENARLRDELAAAKAQARNAQVDAERRQRRDLVPLRQAVAVFGEPPKFLRQRRRRPRDLIDPSVSVHRSVSGGTGRPETLGRSVETGLIGPRRQGHSRCMALDLAHHLFAALPELRIHPTEKRIRAFVAGDPIIDSTRAMIVWEPRRVVPSYAVPIGDITADLQPAATEATAEELAVEVLGGAGARPALRVRRAHRRRPVVRHRHPDTAAQRRVRGRRSRSRGLRGRRLRRLRRMARGGRVARRPRPRSRSGRWTRGAARGAWSSRSTARRSPTRRTR